MRVGLDFGRGKLPLDLPDDWDVTVIRKPDTPLLARPDAALREAFAAPVGGEPLRQLARRAAQVCIVICDITRPVPNGVILPELIRALLEAGLAPDAITVLVATGLHRPNEGDELQELVGDPWVLETVQVVNHFARRDDEHAYVGTTSRGTVVRLDRRLLDADLRIAVGLVEPHLMAGYSGGRKVIAPGVAHAETITTFHSARFMEHPKCASCVVSGNPLHEEQLEIVGMIGGASAINVVIDAERRPSLINFGEIVQSHDEAVQLVRRSAEVPIAKRFPLVVTSAAGYPLDATYYQTVKAMLGAIGAVEPGGRLVVASACSEGLGSPDFVAAQKRLKAAGPERFLAEVLQKSHADIDEWQTEMQLKAMRAAEVLLYAPGLSAEERALTGLTQVDDLGAALREIVRATGDHRVAVIPEGPYVVPRFRPRAS